jgi:protocatechuate 3,4-dioxygenase beta subunit
MAGLSPEPRTTTDEAGRFDFGAQPAAKYVVTAEAQRLTAALTTIDLRDPTTTPDKLSLTLHPCDASIHGTIHDVAGGVIPKAHVVRIEDEIAAGEGAEADIDGAYELCMPVGGYARVMVRADGYAAVSDFVSTFGRMRRDYSLTPGATVVGRVVRESDRSSVAGAIVRIEPDGTQREWTTVLASSDAEGRFRVDGVTPGRHAVTASADGLETAHPVDVIAEVGKSQDDVVCSLVAAYQVAGKVIEHDSGKPMAGMSVQLWSRSHATRRTFDAITQQDGTFVVDHLLPDEYQPFVRGHGIVTKPPPKVQVVSSDLDGVVLDVEEGASISGRITFNGQPVEGADVSAQGVSPNSGHSTTDRDGRYTLRGLQPGTYQMYAESQRVGAFTHGPSISITKGEQKTGVDLPLDLSAAISGVVVDQNDVPVGGVYLSFSLLHGADFGSATTADDGSFTARALSGGGDYIFEVRKTPSSAVTYSPSSGKRFTPISVRDGQSHATNVRIKIRVEHVSIAGRVIDADGKPVPDVLVRASSTEEQERYIYAMIPPTTTDQNGAFVLADVAPGAYTVSASSPRGDGHEEKVAAGRTNVVLHLTGTGGIDGTVEGFDVDAEVVAYGLDKNGGYFRAARAGNTFRMRNLPAGQYNVSATSKDGGDAATITVTPGGVEKLALHKREFGVIEGTIVDETTHAPVAAVDCNAFSKTGISSSYASTDVHGAYRIERVAVGENSITCYGSSVHASGTAKVVAGQVTHTDLTAHVEPEVRRGHAGLVLEMQLSEVLVKSVEHGGPAERAGLVAGDRLLTVDGSPVGRWGNEAALMEIELRPPTTSATLTIERDDKQLTVQLMVEVDHAEHQ